MKDEEVMTGMPVFSVKNAETKSIQGKKVTRLNMFRFGRDNKTNQGRALRSEIITEINKNNSRGHRTIEQGKRFAQPQACGSCHKSCLAGVVRRTILIAFYYFRAAWLLNMTGKK
jgi:hypothetical protein